MNSLRDETRRVIEEAKQIKTTGATGAYTKEFEAMERKLDTIRNLLRNASISGQEINSLQKLETDLRAELNASIAKLQASDQKMDKIYSDINLASVGLDDLRNQGENIKNIANDLKHNSTQLQEANIEGALNLTRQSWQKANLLISLDADTLELSANAERQCYRTETIVNRSLSEFNLLQENNEKDLDKYLLELKNLTSQLPDLNEKMCDKRGDPCDALCGGAGCNKCGGLSCEKGAITRAEKALSYVKDAERNIKEKEDYADDLIRSVRLITSFRFNLMNFIF